MADPHATDLMLGHVGPISYDSKNRTWLYPRSIDRTHITSTIQPLSRCTPASVQSPTRLGSQSGYESFQKQWLFKMAPEVAPAAALLPSLSHESDGPISIMCSESSTLLAIGKASDINHPSRRRDIVIVALASGETGDVLKLIRPISENVTQEDHPSVQIRTINPSFGEEAFYFIGGGPIQQICFASDTKGPTSWLAVRNAQSIMIFRPIFCQISIPSNVPETMKPHCPPSRLFPNPIVTLRGEKLGTLPCADVSFNPWNNKQIAMVNIAGYWSIWNLEGQKRKRATFVALAGPSGHIGDGIPFDVDLGRQAFHNHWGRILWVGNTDTIAVFQRQSLALFDIRSKPKRLRLPDLFHMDSERCVLDVKRNPTRYQQLFILTTSRIIVLEIAMLNDVVGSGDTSYDAFVLLSCRHSRDSRTESLKLDLASDTDACILLLYAVENLVINTYRMTMMDSSGHINCVSDAINLIKTSEWLDEQSSTSVTLCLAPAHVLSTSSVIASTSSHEHLTRDTQFYQILCLGPKLDLFRTLLVSISLASGNCYDKIAESWSNPVISMAPYSRIRSSRRVVDDDFVVLDDYYDYYDHEDINVDLAPMETRFLQPHSLLTLNLYRLYPMVYPNGGYETMRLKSVTDYIASIQDGLLKKTESGHHELMTCYEIMNFMDFFEDVDEASKRLKHMISDLEASTQKDTIRVSFSPIESDHVNQNRLWQGSLDQPLDFSAMYDTLIDIWVSSLPRKAPSPLRLAKERVIRNLSMELFLSSLIVSIQARKAVSGTDQSHHDFGVVLPLRARPVFPGASRAQPSPLESQEKEQPTASDGQSSLRLPSVPSDGNSGPLEQNNEDEAVTRLRSYLSTTKSLNPLGTVRSRILAHWPATLGVDPTHYSWEVVKKNLRAETEHGSQDEGDSYKRRKDAERRRRRTEKFLREQKVDVHGSSPQATSNVPPGSQPLLTEQILSSQPTEPPVPMSQPARGTHGSRTGQLLKKKKKPRAFR